MKSIPSLVASSTVGAAAAGLVFGQPQSPTPSRPSSNKRKAGYSELQHRSFSSPVPRPATSSAVATPPQLYNHSSSLGYLSETTRSAHYTDDVGLQNRLHTPNKTRSAGEPYLRPETANDDRKDSMSSRGSWMRRFSILPGSHSGSPRSSVGPDSPSISFSNGSWAPILSNNDTTTQSQPNKLVKRSTSIRVSAHGESRRTASGTRMPALRRPATSHQRSITLRQQFLGEARASSVSTPHRVDRFSDTDLPVFSDDQPTWRPYFVARPTILARDKHNPVEITMADDSNYTSMKRIPVPSSAAFPTLMHAKMIDTTEEANLHLGHYDWGTNYDSSPGYQHDDLGSDADQHFEKRRKPSNSINLSSPTSWLSRTGSIRLRKRNESTTTNSRRVKSAPFDSIRRAHTSHGLIPRPEVVARNEVHLPSPADHHHNVIANGTESKRPRNVSSPLPPMRRLSSFNVDLNTLGQQKGSDHGSILGGSASTRRGSSRPASGERFKGLSSHPVNTGQQWAARFPDVSAYERGSTLIGSDSEARGFFSADDDETDFLSDTPYDSYRTGATTSIRARGPPLDSMFDESPPSSGNKPKTSDYHELALLSAFSKADNSIIEEDEGMTTPIKAKKNQESNAVNSPSWATLDVDMDDLPPSSPPFQLGTSRNFARESIDYDEGEDEDWTNDDNYLPTNHALAPSANSFSMARSNLSRHNLPMSTSQDTFTDLQDGDQRPKSVFDWAESAPHEKTDNLGNATRPRTAYGKQFLDSRGGRAIGRKGPSAAHIRSQSVPVVPDMNGHRDHSKLVPKFGTWGLGAKGVSEDWDNDFEFDSQNGSDGECSGNKGNIMFVPPAIQASQANVVGHVGQIREVCLLVEDLKRLRTLAQEKGILNGSAADKWREAEGIIALATPDEEDETLSPARSPSVDLSRNNSVRNDGSSRLDPSNTRVDNQAPRRSVLMPDDDIFGSGPAEHDPFDNHSTKSAAAIAKSLMENLHQHRAISDPILSNSEYRASNKMPFDTTSLKDLVQRASSLSRTLAELIRSTDQGPASPEGVRQGERESSPAFVRVFTDPMNEALRPIHRSQSNNSTMSSNIDSSPSRSLARRMQMMTVV